MKLSDEDEKLVEKVLLMRAAAQSMRDLGLMTPENEHTYDLGIMASRQHYLIGVQRETIERLNALLKELTLEYPDLEPRIAPAARKILGDALDKIEAFEERIS
jgi:hypothetical protein